MNIPIDASKLRYALYYNRTQNPGVPLNPTLSQELKPTYDISKWGQIQNCEYYESNATAYNAPGSVITIKSCSNPHPDNDIYVHSIGLLAFNFIANTTVIPILIRDFLSSYILKIGDAQTITATVDIAGWIIDQIIPASWDLGILCTIGAGGGQTCKLQHISHVFKM